MIKCGMVDRIKECPDRDKDGNCMAAQEPCPKLKKFVIKSNYEYEIEATNADEAVELWSERIDAECNRENKTPSNEIFGSLYAEEVKEE